jgi:death-on-curing protein
VTAEPTWLESRDTLPIHEELQREFGGSAGLRDSGLFESALGISRNHFVYSERDHFRLAAAYAVALTRNHPFVDGNKRTAFMAAYVFLGVNGHDFQAREEDVVRTMLLLAQRKLSEEELSEWLRESCVPARGTKRRKKP